MKRFVLWIVIVVMVGVVHYLTQPIWAEQPPAIPLAAGDSPREIYQSLSVAQAYRAIPHGKTTFDVSSANIPEDEAMALGQLFAIVDRAVVERVETLQRMKTGDFSSAGSNYPELLRQLQNLEVPEKQQRARQLILEAVNEQYANFGQWQQAGGAISFRDPYIISSHRKLIGAYRWLLKAYPNATPHNKKAFFDHLCALDFI